MRGQISAEHARLGVLSVVMLGLVACGGPSSDRNAPLDARPAAAGGAAAAAHPAKVVSAEAKAALDAGNAAFRAKDYVAALTAFEKARTLAPDNAAPWFGIYMVAQARNDTKAADAALIEIRKRPD